METCPLDASVAAALASLEQRGVPAPVALLSLATGSGMLSTRLQRAGRLPFSKIDGTPPMWRSGVLGYGELDTLPVWIHDHAPDESGVGDPPWHAAFPLWLAAEAGASTSIHVTAGSSLDGEALPVGTIGLVRDHLNLSGSTPLLGLRDSRLGAQFPDQTRVHDSELRSAAAQVARTLGLATREVVVACTLGPALETAAERRAFARVGADVSAQGLADVLIAGAHSGLGGLTLVLVTHAGDDALDIARIAARSLALAPAIEDLIVQLARDVRRIARTRLEEQGA